MNWHLTISEHLPADIELAEAAVKDGGLLQTTARMWIDGEQRQVSYRWELWDARPDIIARRILRGFEAIPGGRRGVPPR
jgi:hypothetical protein